MPTHMIVKYIAATMVFGSLVALSVTALQKKPLEKHQEASLSPAKTRIIVTMKKTPEPHLSSPGKISHTNGKMHDLSGAPTTITESGKVTGSLPTGPFLVTSPSLGVDFIAPTGHSLKQGDPVCLTFQRFPSGAIANLSLAEGACKK